MAVRLARRTWKRIDPDDIVASWAAASTALIGPYAALQQASANTALDAQSGMLADDGDYVRPSMFVDPSAFGKGYAPSGVRLADYFSGPVYDALTLIRSGVSVADAMGRASTRFGVLAGLGIADTARQAAGVDTATRPGVGYVRVVSPGACARCMILAGKFYRWNQGFLRHPHCYCRHVPSTSAVASGMLADPREAFDRLSHDEQDRTFGRASAQAIRDGADMSQVVNARAGVASIGSRARTGKTIPSFTTSGTANLRGNNKSVYNRMGGNGPRLTPEGIYAKATSRSEALELLRSNGYIIPNDLRDDVFSRLSPDYEPIGGALGRGGRAKSASQAYRDAARSGIRNPDERATMTTAERRLYDARLRYNHALSGNDMQEMAVAERNYRHMLASNGQTFTR